MQPVRNAQHEVVLSTLLRRMIYLTALIDLVLGLLFFLGPELKVTLWPTPIGSSLMRFIGAIVFANGVGAIMAASQGTWAGARALFMVAIVYGVAVFLGLVYNLLANGAESVFWVYVLLDALFLGPILYVYWSHERAFRAGQ